jgi:hypothetical protein
MTKTGKKITRDWFENWSNEYDRTLGALRFTGFGCEKFGGQARR